MRFTGRMNYMLIPTFVIAAILFFVGTVASRNVRGMAFACLCAAGFVVAIPGIAYAAYYLKLLGEPILLYQLRSAPFSEVYAGASGFIAGLVHGKFATNERFRRVVGAWFFPGI